MLSHYASRWTRVGLAHIEVHVHDQPGDALFDDPPPGLEAACLAGTVWVERADGTIVVRHAQFTVNREILRKSGMPWVANIASRNALKSVRR